MDIQENFYRMVERLSDKKIQKNIIFIGIFCAILGILASAIFGPSVFTALMGWFALPGLAIVGWHFLASARED